MELTAIPGVGTKTATALDTLEDPEGALAEGDVATIARAPGISPGRAARIARAAIRARYDDDGEFLVTERAESLYRELLDLLQDHATTSYGAQRLETFFPTSSPDRIAEVQDRTRTALQRPPAPKLDNVLRQVEPLESPEPVRVRDRCIATADAERYELAASRCPEISVEIVDDTRGLADLATGYSTVIAIDERFAGLDIEGDVRVRPDALEDPVSVIPERPLAFFAHNRDTVLAAAAVHRRMDLDAPTDLDRLTGALERLGPDGEPKEDDQFDRLSSAIDELDRSVEMASTTANDRLREAIRARDVTVEGTDLLSLVERGAGVDTLLSRELSDEFDTAISSARQYLVDALDLEGDWHAHVERVFPEKPTFPVTADEDAVATLRTELKRTRDRRARTLKQKMAASLAATRPDVETLVKRTLELDVELAIARFARDFDCTLPTFGGDGIAIEGGRSPLLDLPPPSIEPVDYAVSDAVLLSGVNSGGKTSLLDLLATTAILAHMGLPVPADDVRLQRFDALHYHAATQGTLDAGAFEATVQQFAELATATGDRLVLVDELESITEPGAAAIIVGGILEELKGEATAVFVSHLAGEIKSVTDADVRVDGIAATGVENGELLVDRTPIRDHLARSTPELIVEQLAASGSGSEIAIYERLLEKFDTPGG